MLKRLVLLGLAVLIGLAGATKAQREPLRLALLIGNESYNDAIGRLRNPANDVKKVGTALRNVGFEIVGTITDASRDAMMDSLHDLATRLARAGEGAIGFVYYTGHGVSVGSENILIPVNVEDTSDRALSVRGVSLKQVVDTLIRLSPKAAHFVVIDACRSNIGGQRGAKGFAPYVDHRQGMVIAFSTAPGETASDVGRESGPYAAALASELVKPGRTDQEVFNAVRSRVAAETSPPQIPWTHDGLIGDRVIFKPAQVASVAHTPKPLEMTFEQKAEISFWDTVRANPSLSQLRAYLNRYPNGTFIELAIAIIEKIEREQGPKIAVAVQSADAAIAADLSRLSAASGGTQSAPAIGKGIPEAHNSHQVHIPNQARPEPSPSQPQPVSQSPTDQAREAIEEFERRAKETWERAEKLGDPRTLQSFLMEFGASSFADFARIKLASLTKTDVSKGEGTNGPGATIVIRANVAAASILRSVAVSPDGKDIAVAGDDGVVRVLASGDYTVRRQFSLPADGIGLRSIVYSGDGSVLAAASNKGVVRLWDYSTGHSLSELDSDSEKLLSVSYYPVENNRYLISAGSGGVEIWNMKTRKVVGRPALHRGVVRAVAYSFLKNGSFVSGGEDGQVVFYLPQNRQKVVDAHRGGVFGLAYSNDNKLVVSAGGDGLLKLWSTDTQSLKNTFRGHSRYVLAVALEKSGKFVASGGADKSVRIWSISNGDAIAILDGHQKDVESVAFVGGGQAISVSEDKTLRVWDIASKREILTMAFYADGDYVAVTPDGYYMGSPNVERRLEMVENGRPRSLPADLRTARRLGDGFRHGNR